MNGETLQPTKEEKFQQLAAVVRRTNRNATKAA